MTNYTVYALHLPNEDYRYIGYTEFPTKRFNNHKTQARTGNDLPVYRWIRKHIDDVQMTVIDILETSEQALAMEEYWIQASRVLGHNMLNVHLGGRDLPEVNREPRGPMSEESKAKLSASLTGKKRTPEMKERQRQARLDKYKDTPLHTEESKAKIAENNPNRVRDDELFVERSDGSRVRCQELECPVCGESFIAQPRAKRDEGKPRYCSRECMYNRNKIKSSTFGASIPSAKRNAQ